MRPRSMPNPGKPIRGIDTLIGGVREAGGTPVTRDGSFERVSVLEVNRYDAASPILAHVTAPNFNTV